MRIYLDQIGCRLNYSEMETLAARLQAVGHQPVNEPEQAQVIVFNSCAVTQGAVRSSRSTVRRLHRANTAAPIAVTGCWATLNPNDVAAEAGVALVAPNERKEMLDLLLEPWSAEFDDPEQLAQLAPDGIPFQPASAFDQREEERNVNALQHGNLQHGNIDLVDIDLDEIAPRRRRTRGFLKVQDGCNNKCTFCIVTVARGSSHSYPRHELVQQVQSWVEEGVQEVVLTGVHLGSYGRDLMGAEQHDLKTLTDAILRHTDIQRVRLSSLEPWELADGFFDLWQQWPERLCPHLHLPLQAGTDKQLRHMARRCTTASFRQLMQDARTTIPNLTVTTDLIAGFPGETEIDFCAGLAFVEEMRFAHAHIFPFSSRTGTAAATFSGHVPNVTKKERARELRLVVERTGLAERQRFLGTVRPVLFEGVGQPLTDEPGLLWSGLTDNYLRVNVVVPAEVDLHNQCLPTMLSDVDGDTMVGEIQS